MIEIITWLLIPLIIGTASAIIGKRYGPECLVGMFAGSIVIANVVASKIISIGPFSATAGVIVYSITFLLTDTISEFWGKKEAKKAVWSGFFALVMLVFVTQIVIKLTPAMFWESQEAFALIFGNTWRVVLASFIAYTLSQNHDIWAYHFWKKKTGKKHLWFRNNASTWVSQTIDTIIFTIIAFWGLFPVGQLILGGIVLKIAIAIIDTPFLYFIRWYYKGVKPEWKR